MMMRTLLVAALACVCVDQGEARQFGWGAETWDCGRSWYSIQLENGQDVYVSGITGWVSAAASPLADFTKSRMRQALIAVTYNGAQASAHAVVTGSPTQTQRYQHEVDGNLYAVNVKQTQNNDVHIPATATFPAPVLVPGGNLQMLIETVTYDGAAEITSPSTECLDTEVHLIVSYTLTPP